MADENLYTLIDRYLTAQMTEPERLEFEQRVKEEPELAEELRLHVQAEYAARTYAHEQRKAKFNEEFEHAGRQGQSGGVRPFRLAYWGRIAAAVVILVGLAFIFWPEATTSSDFNTLYTQEISTQVMSVRRGIGDTSSLDNLWLNASTQFNQAQYQEAISSIQTVLADTAFTHEAKAQLFLGLSHLKLQENLNRSVQEAEGDHLMKAVRAFEKVSAESAFIENALWFTALAYIQSNDTLQAISALDKVIDYPFHYKKETAEALRERFRARQE